MDTLSPEWQSVVDALDRLRPDANRDPEEVHMEADSLILAALPSEVRRAYAEVVARCDWWAYA